MCKRRYVFVPWPITTDAGTIIGIFICQWLNSSEVESFRQRSSKNFHRKHLLTHAVAHLAREGKCEFFVHRWEPFLPKAASLESLQLHLRADGVNPVWCRIPWLSDGSIAGAPAYRTPALRLSCGPYNVSTGRLWGVVLVKKVLKSQEGKNQYNWILKQVSDNCLQHWIKLKQVIMARKGKRGVWRTEVDRKKKQKTIEVLEKDSFILFSSSLILNNFRSFPWI